MGVFARRGVRVHTQYARLRKQSLDILLRLLRARAEVADMAAPAFGTGGRGRFAVAAVVAHEPVVLEMVGHGDAARGAFRDIAAGAAAHKGVVPAPVDKQDALFARVQVLGKLALEREAQHGCVPVPEFVAQVDDVHGRLCGAVVAGRQFVVAVAALAREEIGFERGRRRR